MTNWKSFVNTDNAKRYVLPAGWDSKERIAEQLECSEDSVRRILSAALKSGEVEQGVFPVWDAITGRLVRVTAFRRVVVGLGQAKAPRSHHKKPQLSPA